MGYFSVAEQRLADSEAQARAELEGRRASYMGSRQAKIDNILLLQQQSAELLKQAGEARSGGRVEGEYLKERTQTSSKKGTSGSKAKTPKGLTPSQQGQVSTLLREAVAFEGAFDANVVPKIQDMLLPDTVDGAVGLDQIKSLIPQIMKNIEVGENVDLSEVENNIITGLSEKLVFEDIVGMDQASGELTFETEGATFSTETPPDTPGEYSQFSRTQETQRPTARQAAQEEKEKRPEYNVVARAVSDDGVISETEQLEWEESGGEGQLQDYLDEFYDDQFIQRMKLAGDYTTQAQQKRAQAAATQAEVDKMPEIGAISEEMVATRAQEIDDLRGEYGFGKLRDRLEKMEPRQRRKIMLAANMQSGRQLEKPPELDDEQVKTMAAQLDELPPKDQVDAADNLAVEIDPDPDKARAIADYLLQARNLLALDRFKRKAAPVPEMKKAEKTEFKGDKEVGDLESNTFGQGGWYDEAMGGTLVRGQSPEEKLPLRDRIDNFMFERELRRDERQEAREPLTSRGAAREYADEFYMPQTRQDRELRRLAAGRVPREERRIERRIARQQEPIDPLSPAIRGLEEEERQWERKMAQRERQERRADETDPYVDVVAERQFRRPEAVRENERLQRRIERQQRPLAEEVVVEERESPVGAVREFLDTREAHRLARRHPVPESVTSYVEDLPPGEVQQLSPVRVPESRRFSTTQALNRRAEAEALGLTRREYEELMAEGIVYRR